MISARGYRSMSRRDTKADWAVVFLACVSLLHVSEQRLVAADRAPPLKVYVSPIQSAFLDLQRTRQEYTLQYNLSQLRVTDKEGKSEKVLGESDWTPILCMVTIINTSARRSIPMYSPLLDNLGMFAVRLEFVSPAATRVRWRGDNPEHWISSTEVDSYREELRAGGSVSIPIAISEYSVPELNFRDILDGKIKMRAIYRYYFPTKQKTDIDKRDRTRYKDFYSDFVPLRDLFLTRMTSFGGKWSELRVENMRQEADMFSKAQGVSPRNSK